MFVEALKIELGGEYFAKNLVESDGFYAVNLAGPEKFVFVAMMTSSEQCSIWKYILNDHDILSHMEEDIGIFDPEGLLAYAAYFRDALVGDTRIAKLSDEIITDELDAILLVLEYKIGNQTLEGRLQLKLVQSKLDKSVFSMMKALYCFDPAKKIITGTRNTLAVWKQVPAAATAGSDAGTAAGGNDNEDAQSESGDQISGGGGQSSASGGGTSTNAAAMNAKKRRVGGVNIFPGRRKK